MTGSPKSTSTQNRFQSTPKLEALFEWGKRNGAYIHPELKIVADSHNNLSTTAITLSTIPPGTKILEIPHRLAITYDVAVGGMLGDVVRIGEGEESGQKKVSHYAILAAYLALEYLKAEEGFWWPYLATLPVPGKGCGGPMFWGGGESGEEGEGGEGGRLGRWLRGTNLARETVKEVEVDWVGEWRDVKTGLEIVKRKGKGWKEEKLVDGLTWEMYKWAASVFSSRAFPERLVKLRGDGTGEGSAENGERWTSGVRVDGGEKGNGTGGAGLAKSALFPVLDVLNHRPRTKITWVTGNEGKEDGLGRVGFVCGEELLVGGEVWNNYGPKPNQQLLLSYGFAIEGNPDDTVMLKFRPPLNPIQQDIRRQQIPEKEDTGIYHIHASDCHPPERLVQLFRILVANEWERRVLEGNPVESITLTSRNEIKAKMGILAALRRKLGLLLDTEPKLEGKEMEADIDVDPQEYFAKVFRRGQTEILHKAVGNVEKDVKALCEAKESLVVGMDWFEQEMPEFAEAVETCFGDRETRGESGTEEVAVLLGVCYLVLRMKEGKLGGGLVGKVKALLERYPMPEGGEEEMEDVQRVEGLYEQVFPAVGEVCPDVFGGGEGRWSARFVGWGARVLEGEGVKVWDWQGEGGEERDVVIL